MNHTAEVKVAVREIADLSWLRLGRPEEPKSYDRDVAKRIVATAKCATCGTEFTAERQCDNVLNPDLLHPAVSGVRWAVSEMLKVDICFTNVASPTAGQGK